MALNRRLSSLQNRREPTSRIEFGTSENSSGSSCQVRNGIEEVGVPDWTELRHHVPPRINAATFAAASSCNADNTCEYVSSVMAMFA